MTRMAATLMLSVSVLVGACATVPGAPSATGSAERPLADLPPANAAQGRAKTHTELGMAYAQIGRYDVALDEAKAALQQDSGYAPAYHLMGLVHMFIGDSAAAREHFGRALQAAPNDPEFNNSYGWFQCVNGEEREGLQRLALAARNPYYRTPARAHTNAGLCYLRLKDDAAAEAEFRRATGLDPRNTQALYHLAEIAYRQGSYQQARSLLVELHQQREPTAESVWLGLRTERRLGNREAEASYAAQLRGRFAGTPEFRDMNQGNYQ